MVTIVFITDWSYFIFKNLIIGHRRTHVGYSVEHWYILNGEVNILAESHWTIRQLVSVNKLTSDRLFQSDMIENEHSQTQLSVFGTSEQPATLTLTVSSKLQIWSLQWASAAFITGICTSLLSWSKERTFFSLTITFIFCYAVMKCLSHSLWFSQLGHHVKISSHP